MLGKYIDHRQLMDGLRAWWYEALSFSFFGRVCAILACQSQFLPIRHGVVHRRAKKQKSFAYQQSWQFIRQYLPVDFTSKYSPPLSLIFIRFVRKLGITGCDISKHLLICQKMLAMSWYNQFGRGNRITCWNSIFMHVLNLCFWEVLSNSYTIRNTRLFNQQLVSHRRSKFKSRFVSWASSVELVETTSVF